MKITKAVILAAGLGTRFFPVTKVVPKELLPLVDKPILHYLVEEAVASGIKEISIVLSPAKRIIKKYFSSQLQLEHFLKKRKKAHLLKEVKKISRAVRFFFSEQKEPLGVGNALLSVRSVVKKEPFALFFGDDLIEGKIPCLKQLINVYQKFQKTILAISPVSQKDVIHYGIIKPKEINQQTYQVLDLIEKPSLTLAPSNLAIVGRYILTPKIFAILSRLKPRKNEEVYLTDALKILLKTEPIYAYKARGQWLSCGHKAEWLIANLKLGLKHPETKKILREYLKIAKSFKATKSVS